jgi:hypothetical protein
MACKNTYAGGTRCEGTDKTVWIGENTWAQSQPERASPKCTIHTLYQANPPCVVDPAPNEPTCNHEARMAVAKRHGFEDMAHANMSEAIQGSERLQREFDKTYTACMTKNNYCVYREESRAEGEEKQK